MKLREIERLRGVSILYVMLAHAAIFGFPPPFLRHGGTGVYLFFVISGYVIATSLLRDLPRFADDASFLERLVAARPALAAFFARRFYRLVPLAIVAWALAIALSSLHENPKLGSPSALTREGFYLLSGIYNYFAAIRPETRLIFFWTLSVEEQFYLFLPLLWIALPRESARWIAGLATMGLVTFILRPFVACDPPAGARVWAWHTFTTHHVLDAPMFGVMLALARDRAWGDELRLPRRLWSLAIVPALALFVLIYPAAIQGSLNYFDVTNSELAIFAACTALVFVASLDRGLVFAWPGVDRGLEWLGSRSYAIYISHWTLFRFLGPLLVEKAAYLTDWQVFTISLASALALAELLHGWIEMPILRYGRRRIAAAMPTPLDVSEVPRAKSRAM